MKTKRRDSVRGGSPSHRFFSGTFLHGVGIRRVFASSGCIRGQSLARLSGRGSAPGWSSRGGAGGRQQELVWRLASLSSEAREEGP